MIYIALVMFLGFMLWRTILNALEKDNGVVISTSQRQSFTPIPTGDVMQDVNNMQLQSVLEDVQSQLKEQHKVVEVNNAVKLSQVAQECLSVYDANQIRLPIEIVEEVSFQNLQTHKEVFEFIETSRYNMINDLKKKLPKGVIK